MKTSSCPSNVKEQTIFAIAPVFSFADSIELVSVQILTHGLFAHFRDLAHQFNNTYKTDYFPQCDWLLTEVPRIRSLRNPDLKMSKSDPSEKSRINLDDDADTIELRIKQAVTDSIGKVRNLFTTA